MVRSNWANPGLTFRSLRNVAYRRYYAGSVVSVLGTWMQRVGQDWLVLELTHSGIALGISSAMQFLPVPVGGLWAGAFFDRHERRRLLLVTQSVSALLALILGVLTATGSITLVMVYALSLALGVVTVFDTPARQVFVAELVGPQDLLNAQSVVATLLVIRAAPEYTRSRWPGNRARCEKGWRLPFAITPCETRW